MKKKINFLTFVILFSLIFNLLSRPLFAGNMYSGQYKIQFGNVNIGGNNEVSTSYKLATTLGQTSALQFSSTGYIVKAGFQYIHSIIPFAFTISNTKINFGILTPNTFATGTTNLTVSSGGAGGYQVTSIEESRLKSIAGNYIPDAICNGGPNCTTTTAQPWTSTLKDGFGYSMSGNDVPADFIGSTYFRPFPDRSAAASPAIVMSNAAVGKNRLSTMTFKVNVLGTQPDGSYQTIINYVATPIY